MRKLVLMFLFFFAVVQLQAQCPYGRSNCKGECGNFSDEDGDGYCDWGLVTKEKQAKEESKPQTGKNTAVDKTKSDKTTPTNGKNQTDAASGATTTTEAVSGATNMAASDTESIEQLNNELDSLDKTELAADKSANHKKKSYHLISISLATLLAYLFTHQLQRKKYIKKATHRKIWNCILLVSFLFAGLLGLFLVFQINYHFAFSIYPTICTLHVELGIVMAIVSIIHCLWHIDYYKKIFKQKKISD